MAIQNSLDAAAACEPIAAVQGISASDGKTKWFAPMPAGVIHWEFIPTTATAAGTAYSNPTDAIVTVGGIVSYTNNTCNKVRIFTSLYVYGAIDKVTNNISGYFDGFVETRINGGAWTFNNAGKAIHVIAMSTPAFDRIGGQGGGVAGKLVLNPGDTVEIRMYNHVFVDGGTLKVGQFDSYGEYWVETIP